MRATSNSARESGQTLVLVALLTPVLLAFAALVLDVGLAYSEYQRAQAAADSSAYAGAVQIAQMAQTEGDCSHSSVRDQVAAVARQYASQNGFDATTLVTSTPSFTYTYTTSDVTVTATCPYSGSYRMVEVTIQKSNVGGYFPVLFSDFLNPRARAVATFSYIPPSGAPFVALGTCPSYTGPGVSVKGGSALTVTGTIISDSCSSASITVDGSGSTMSADSILTPGQCKIANGAAPIVPCPDDNGTAADPLAQTLSAVLPCKPLANLPYPCTDLTGYNNYNPPVGITVIGPGVYKGINFTGAGGTLYLRPGVYVFLGSGLKVASGNGFKVCRGVSTGPDIEPGFAGGPSFTAGPGATGGIGGGCSGVTSDTAGVLLFNTVGNYNVNSTTTNCPAPSGGSGDVQILGSAIDLEPLHRPNSDPLYRYNGLLVWQDRCSSQTVSLAGGTDTNTSGTVYVPNGTVKLSGSGGIFSIDSKMYARNYEISGGAGFLVTASDTNNFQVLDVFLIE
jgi:hypothetical protein